MLRRYTPRPSCSSIAHRGVTPTCVPKPSSRKISTVATPVRSASTVGFNVELARAKNPQQFVRACPQLPAISQAYKPSRITSNKYSRSISTSTFVELPPLIAEGFAEKENNARSARFLPEAMTRSHTINDMMLFSGIMAAAILLAALSLWGSTKDEDLPEEKAVLTLAPNVPPPITRKHSVRLVVEMCSLLKVAPIDNTNQFEFWTFEGGVPGPFIRAREGDVLDMRLTNRDPTGMQHNVDFHAVLGPGGGAGVLTADGGETRRAEFKLTTPGLYIYHCAVAPVGYHIGNGMYGLILVEPKGGLPKVDREYYVVQGDFYTEDEPSDSKDRVLASSYERGLNEQPTHVVFNGRVGALTEEGTLKAKTNERIRLFFGNAGPNLVSSFHIIGAILDKVWREGDLVNPPARGLQTTLVPAGGATMIELSSPVPGTLTLVDHSIWRIEKGAVGFLDIEGEPRPDLFRSDAPPRPCPACKLHP